MSHKSQKKIKQTIILSTNSVNEINNKCLVVLKELRELLSVNGVILHNEDFARNSEMLEDIVKETKATLEDIGHVIDHGRNK